jgi:hypothetical protein
MLAFTRPRTYRSHAAHLSQDGIGPHRPTHVPRRGECRLVQFVPHARERMVVVDLARWREVHARDFEHALHSATNVSCLLGVALCGEKLCDSGKRTGEKAALAELLSQHQIFAEERIRPCIIPSLHREGSHEVEGVRGHPDIPTRPAQGMCLLDQC